MKKLFLLSTLSIAFVTLAQATTLVTGSPNDNNVAGATLTVHTGTTLVNFDNLTPLSTVASNALASFGVQSITSTSTSNPLEAFPFSSQSAPNYISTQSGTGGILISFTHPTNNVGIGILESDGVSDTIEALDASNNILGSFTVTVPTTGKTPYNGYWALVDPTQDIKSFEILSTGKFGIDDLQFAPEPANLFLAGAGVLFLAAFACWRRKGFMSV